MTSEPTALHPDRLAAHVDDGWVTSHELCNLTGITYRQVDYWCRTNLLTPIDEEPPGSGRSRRFHTDQIHRGAVLGDLTAIGVSLQVCRQIIDDVVRDGTVTLGGFAITRVADKAVS